MITTIQMPLQLFSNSSKYSEQLKNDKNSSSSISRHQARRVSLPNSLINNQGGGGLRSPRSRTPNSLSPKIGFLKEISEFDIDPPFISPGASSSSSADNSNCNSPMLLSPFSHRPASARPYRRNKINNNQNQQSQSKIQEENDKNNKSVQRSNRNIQSMRAGRRSEPFIFGNPEANDDFKWTDVDGFYGRKNSIPLHQLLANDLTLLNKGIHAKNNNEQTNEGPLPSPLTINKQFNDISSDNNLSELVVNNNEIIENNKLLKEENNSSEDSLKIGKFKKRQESRFKNHRTSLEEIKKSSSAPMSSPTKRRLQLIKNKLYSLEDDKKGIKIEIDEKDNLEIENQSDNLNVKFMDSVEELLNNNNEKEDNDDVNLLRQILKSKKQPIQQFRHFNVDQNGQRIVDSGVRTIRSKIHSNNKNIPIKIRNPKARRATCPEIWLSEAENEERLIISCAVRLFGCNSLASLAEVCPPDDGIVSTDCEDVQRPYQTVSFLLNEHEINMQIIQGSLLPQSQKGLSDSFEEFTIFAVVYSVDNRESFIRAAQILYRLYGDQKIAKRGQKIGNKKKTMENTFLPLILIANKSDLQRKRRINSIEGKMLAKIYKCPFVEMSALLSANVDILWNEVIRKLYKYEQIVDHFIVEKQESNEINELTVRPPFIGRIMERTRRFAKSCEDWITTKIVAS